MENLLLRTKSRDGLYEANAIYNNGLVTVLKGSKINMLSNNGLKPDSEAAHKRSNPLIVSAEGIMSAENRICPASLKATGVSLPEWVVNRRGSPPSLETM